MFRVFKMYMLVPVSGAETVVGSLAIPATGKSLYASAKNLGSNRQAFYSAINEGLLRGVSISGADMGADEILREVLYICDEAEAYEMSSSIHQVNWNIRVSPQLVALVRGEMLDVSLSAMGLDPTAMLSKLSGVVGAIQVGMFIEARNMLLYAMERDAFLTEERIAKYAALLKAADAIDYTI